MKLEQPADDTFVFLWLSKHKKCRSTVQTGHARPNRRKLSRTTSICAGTPSSSSLRAEQPQGYGGHTGVPSPPFPSHVNGCFPHFADKFVLFFDSWAPCCNPIFDGGARGILTLGCCLLPQGTFAPGHPELDLRRRFALAAWARMGIVNSILQWRTLANRCSASV